MKRSSSQRESKMLRISILGGWSVEDFANYFSSISRVALLLDPDPDRNRAIVPNAFTPESRMRLDVIFESSPSNLQVVEHVFSSPGHTDLAGIAGVLREIRIFIQFFIERRDARERNKLDESIARMKREYLESLDGEANDWRVAGAIQSGEMDSLLVLIADGRISGVEDRT